MPGAYADCPNALTAVMHKSFDPRRYSLASYDRHLCLKPPLLLWLAALFLSRAISLPLVIGLGSLGGGSANVNGWCTGCSPSKTIFDVYLCLYVLLSKRVRDVFADFPTA